MAEIEKKGLELDGALDGSGMRVGIVHTRWNADVVNSLVGGAEDQLVRASPLLLLLLVLVLLLLLVVLAPVSMRCV